MRTLALCLSLAAGLAFAEEEAEPKNVLALETRWRDESGEKVTLGAWKGRWYALTFVYTSCAGTCPAVTTWMRRTHGANRWMLRRE